MFFYRCSIIQKQDKNIRKIILQYSQSEMSQGPAVIVLVVLMGISGKKTAGGNPDSAAPSLFTHLYNFLDQNSLNSIWRISAFWRFQYHTQTNPKAQTEERKEALPS